MNSVNKETIDWTRFDQLSRGNPVTITKETCALAEIIASEAGDKDDPKMELAIQVAIWREAYQNIRREFKIPDDADSRKALGFSDINRLRQENSELRTKLSKARYALLSGAAQMKQAAEDE